MTILELPTGRCRTPSLAVRVLGPLAVQVDGQDRTPQAAKLRTLLLTLALHRPTPLPADVLIDELWPEPPRSARNVLQSYVSRLRRLVEDAQADVEHTARGYLLTLPHDALDLDRYRGALRAADAAASDQDRLTHLSEAVATWQGEPAAELTLGARGDAALCELIDAHLDRREERAVLCLGLGDTATATAELRDLVARRPLQEPTWGHLIDALHAAGNPAAALQAYEQLRQLLAEELGTDPGPQLRRRHAALLAEDASALPGSPPATFGQRRREPTPEGRFRAAGAAPPAPSSPLIGRDAELAQLAESLRSTRAMTITGSAGIGKTRLAIEVVNEVVAGQEVLGFVELDDCRGRRDVLRAMRDAVCPELRADATLAELVPALSAASGLIVLDGAEGAVDACAHLAAALLPRCPQLRLLVTSQEPLRVRGEHLVALAPLATPRAETSAGEQLASAAVRLLLERARAAGWQEPVDARVASHLGELARRLDGLPLAIELAAGRLQALPIERLLDRLERPLDELRDGPRGTPDRHRTIEAAITANLRLIHAEDRELLTRMAVVRSPVRVEDIRRIAAPDGATIVEVEDAIGRLTRASLLQADADGRVRMLGMVRAVADRQLAQRDDARQVAARHTAWVLAQVDGAEGGQRGPDRARWWRRLRRLRADIGVTFDRVVDDGDVTTAAALVDALWWHWYLVGDLRAALSRVERTLRLSSGHDPVAEARLRGTAALFAGLLGDHDRAREDATQAATQLSLAGDLTGAGMAGMVASLATLPTDPLRALDLGLEALSLHEQAGDRWCVAASSQAIAALHLATGDVAGAARHAQVSDDLFAELDDPYGISLVAQVRADIALATAHPERASRQLARALEAARAASHTFAVATTVVRLAVACVQAGETAAAARLLGAARTLEWRTGFALDAHLPGVSGRIDRAVRAAHGDAGDELAETGARDDAIRLAREILGRMVPQERHSPDHDRPIAATA